MSIAYQIVVCAGIVPDPLQTLEPVASPQDDFRLKPDSSALRLGFRPIDLSGVGPRK